MNLQNQKIAWLLPSTFFYWQPSIVKLSELFPETRIFTALWCGFASGFEDKLSVQVVGERRELVYAQSEKGYSSKIAYLSPSIISYLLKFKPAVIFSNSFGLWTLLALVFKPLGRWKVIIAYEGSSPSVDFKQSPLRLWIRRQMLNFSDASISNSHAGEQYLIEILGASPKEVFVQPYEVPEARLLEAKVNLSAQSEISAKLSLQKPVFLFVGHIIPRKGLNLLLEACHKLNQQGQTNYSVMVVGDGPQKPELERYCKEHNLNKTVQWTGRVDYDDLANYFYCADVFILPTLEDTWGVVTQEAMILGKPVLCSQHAGSKELVEEGKNGYCFAPEDTERMAELMGYFIEHPTLASTMGTYAKTAIAKYSPTAAAEFMTEIVKEVLAETR